MKAKLIIEFEHETPTSLLDRLKILSGLSIRYEDVVKPTLETEIEIFDMEFVRVLDVAYREGLTLVQ